MVTGIGVLLIEGERFPVPQKVDDVIHWNRESQSLSHRDFHVRHADHLTAAVEEGPAGVPGADLCGHLQVDLAVDVALRVADDPFGHAAGQAQGAADRERDVSLANLINKAQIDLPVLPSVGVGNW